MGSKDPDSLSIPAPLGEVIDTPLARILIRLSISPESHPWLADHVLLGDVALPAALHMAYALSLADDRAAPGQICGFTLSEACRVPRTGTGLQITVGHDDQIALYAKSDNHRWVRHARGVVEARGPRPAAIDVSALRERLREDTAGPGLLPAALADFGLLLGPTFRRVTRLWRGQSEFPGETLAEIRNPASEGWPVHPASLDACLQPLSALLCDRPVGHDPARSVVITGLDRAVMWEAPAGGFLCHIRMVRLGKMAAVGDVTLLALDGRILGQLEGVRAELSVVGLSVAGGSAAEPEVKSFLAFDWQPHRLLSDGICLAGQAADAVSDDVRALDSPPGLGPALTALAAGMTRRLRVLEINGQAAADCGSTRLLLGRLGPLLGRYHLLLPDRTGGLPADLAARPGFSSGPFDPADMAGVFDLVLVRDVPNAALSAAHHLAIARSALAAGGVFLMDRQGWTSYLGDAGFADPRQFKPDHSASGSYSDSPLITCLIAGSGTAPLLLVHGDEAGDQADSRQLARQVMQGLVAQGYPAQAMDAGAALNWLRGSAPLAGLVHLASLDLDDREMAAVLPDLHGLIRVALTRAEVPGLWLVTRGAQGGGSAVGAASLWGLGSVAGLEHPDLRLRMIDLDPASPVSPEPLLGELTCDRVTADAVGTAVLYRAGQRLIPRPLLRHVPADHGVLNDAEGHSVGTALVTGGFGTIGPVLADWLLLSGRASAVVLSGQEPPPPELEDRGFAGLVRLRQLDVTDEAAVGELLTEIDETMPGLSGLFHLAEGEPTANPVTANLLSQDWDSFQAVLTPRVQAALILDRLTRDRPLRDFVLFTGTDGLFGAAGRAPYAAATATVAALVEARHRASLPGLLLEWGPWQLDSPDHGIATDEALDALSRALGQDRFARLGYF